MVFNQKYKIFQVLKLIIVFLKDVFLNFVMIHQLQNFFKLINLFNLFLFKYQIQIIIVL